ncbi:glycoside hydrolase family 28 protein [Pedobacter sp. MW01-1-1]|uniref:glycoside hydrolase family 28 protein n=1 Tax=Pedobacter sp. MW01-1-1 TaxID=3383027 RepID=UPI003FF11308
MIKKILLLAVLSVWIVAAYAIKNVPSDSVQLKAPFKMPAVKVPLFKGVPIFSILDFGAKKGDKEKNMQAIASAIDKANAKGGGIVFIPAGEWLTGKIHLKSNVNLHLEKGAVLLFSENPNDYLPAVHTTWEGMECFNYSPLVYAYKCKNVAISGEGELKAKMDVWKTWFTRPKGHMESIKRLYLMAMDYVPVEKRQMVNDTAHLRPQFIQFNRCENVLLEGVTITNSPFWTIHPYLSKNITIRNIKVFAHGHNNDGVDPEMSQQVLIENCIFDQGDDAIAIKSGRNPEGWRLKTPSKNIIIQNCLVKNGHQLVAIGSELSGGIENVWVHDCRVKEGAKLNHFIFVKTNERMGGYVKNVYAENLTGGKVEEGILGIETDVLYQWRNLVPTTLLKLTPISDVHLKNIQAGEVKFISRVLGDKRLPVQRISLSQVKATKVLGNPYVTENVVAFTGN